VTSQWTERPGSQAALHLSNQRRVLEQLVSGSGVTQAQAARETGLAPATVSNIVRQLAALGAVEVRDTGHGKVLHLTRGAGLVVGIDHGHRHLTLAVADRASEVLAERRVSLAPNLPAEQGLREAERLLDAALEEIDEPRSAVVGLGLGLPAPVDRTGEVGAPSILPGWFGCNAVALASARFGLPVAVDNDANLGALAEHTWGAGRGAESIAYVKLSDGVGAGLVLDGQLFRGRDGTAGEIGHISTDEFGAVCRCGNRGCVETVIAARHVLELLEDHLGPGQSIASVVARAEQGDSACLRVLADTGRQAGMAIASLCNVFNPERIVIGGEFLLSPLRELVRRHGIPSATAGLQIVRAELGPRASVMGAVAIALRTAPLIGSH
jgi:predicted NBD/HSP70 family sugar kinase